MNNATPNGNGHETNGNPNVGFERTRWNGIRRDYTPQEVARLSGSVPIEYTLADMGARRLWGLLNTTDYVHALGALTGNQAMQMVKAGSTLR